MKKAILVLAAMAMGAAQVQGAWRKVAHLMPVETGTVCRAIINLGRTDWRRVMPLKVEFESAVEAKVNGKALIVTNGVAVIEEAVLGRNNGSVLEYTGPAESQVRLYCTMPDAKGPLLTKEEFFLQHLDTAIPAMAECRQAAQQGDMAKASRLFADYVRRTLPRKVIIGEWLEKWEKLEGKARENELKKLEAAAQNTMDYKFCPITWHQFKSKRIEWEFNPTWNGYDEWCFHLSYFDFANPLAELYLAKGAGQAAEGKERLAEVWRDQITSYWEDEPVPPRGTGAGATKHWRSLECGVRPPNWMKQLCAFIDSSVVTDEFIVTFYRSLWEHGRRLQYDHAGGGNWLTQEMIGLVRIAFFAPFIAEAKEWETMALNILMRELSAQVYDDGFQIELASGYHGGVIWHYFTLLQTLRSYGREVPPELFARLEKMYNLYPSLLRPDLRIPGVNDSSDIPAAKILRRALPLFPMRDDFKWICSDRKEGKPPAQLSLLMPYAGAVIMRTGWDKDAAWAYMDASPFGFGHQHEDKLNVLIYACGKKLLTEGGFYDYDTSDMRRYVLSTRAHNTVRIDGSDQNLRPTYRWHKDDISQKAACDFKTSPTLDVARATFAGPYAARTAHDVTHQRTLLMYKDVPQPFFVVIDRLQAADAAPHSFQQIWHLEDSKMTLDGLKFAADFGGGVNFTGLFAASVTGAQLVDMRGTKEPELQGWMPVMKKGPHEHRPVPTPVLCGNFTGSAHLVTVLAPSRGPCPVAALSLTDSLCTITLTDGTKKELKIKE